MEEKTKIESCNYLDYFDYIEKKEKESYEIFLKADPNNKKTKSLSFFDSIISMFIK